jgi:Fe2+ or Zn2+ uptake regulation protein
MTDATLRRCEQLAFTAKVTIAQMQVICEYSCVDKRDNVREQLREAGFKATPARVALLSLLAREAKPLAVPSILRRLSAEADQATIYRALNSLVKAGLVAKLRIQSGIAHFEFAALPHHHHLICEKCGLVEDVTACCEDPKPAVSSFRQVTQHNLEYSGICEMCAQ